MVRIRRTHGNIKKTGQQKESLKLPPHYLSPVYLSEQLGNNAFDFEVRKKQNPNPQLYIPALIKAPLKNAEIGQHIVFESLDDNQNLISALGLKNFIFDENNGASIYLFDNHNHAFYFWHYEILCQKLKTPLTLIHVDQHRDSRIPANFLTPEESKNLQRVYEYTNQILNVGNFIPPAVKTGAIDQIIFLDSEQSLLEFSKQLPSLSKNFILDIDLDFFAPELNYIKEKLKIETIQKLIPKAKIITIATSPFFIDQKLALEIITKIFSNLITQ